MLRFKVLPQTEGNIFTLYLLSWLLMTWEWKKPGHRQLRLPLQICVVNKSHKNNPTDTRRNNNNVIMTSKRRRDVETTSRRRLDFIMTFLLRRVSVGKQTLCLPVRETG